MCLGPSKHLCLGVEQQLREHHTCFFCHIQSFSFQHHLLGRKLCLGLTLLNGTELEARSVGNDNACAYLYKCEEELETFCSAAFKIVIGGQMGDAWIELLGPAIHLE